MLSAVDVAWCCDLIVAKKSITVFADVVGTHWACGVEYFGHPWSSGRVTAKCCSDCIGADEALRAGMVSKVFR